MEIINGGNFRKGRIYEFFIIVYIWFYLDRIFFKVLWICEFVFLDVDGGVISNC